MSIGFYNAASAMLTRVAELETLAHNLANANTPGFRGLRVSFGNFGETFWHLLSQPQPLMPGTFATARLPLGVTIAQERVDMRKGVMQPTGNPLDVAIDGDGWFVVRTPQGIRYTRKGNFTFASDGSLVTAEGYAVLDETNQPIHFPDQRQSVDQVRIAETGEIFAGTQRLGRLQVVTLERIQPAGAGYYLGVNPNPARARIVQGMLEGSNVQVITELVRMLSCLRTYEMAARTLSAFDALKQALLEATKA